MNKVIFSNSFHTSFSSVQWSHYSYCQTILTRGIRDMTLSRVCINDPLILGFCTNHMLHTYARILLVNDCLVLRLLSSSHTLDITWARGIRLSSVCPWGVLDWNPVTQLNKISKVRAFLIKWRLDPLSIWFAWERILARCLFSRNLFVDAQLELS